MLAVDVVKRLAWNLRLNAVDVCVFDICLVEMSLSADDDDVNNDEANFKSFDVASGEFFLNLLFVLNDVAAVVSGVISTAAEFNVGGLLVRKRLNLEVVIYSSFIVEDESVCVVWFGVVVCCVLAAADVAVAEVDELIKRRRTLNTGLRVTVKPLLLTVAGVRSYS